MTSFAANWLAMREPYDKRSRNPALLDELAASFSTQKSIAVVDLACGTGATVRALAPILPAWQSWRLVDNDLSLLARIAAPEVALEATLTPTPVDLNHDLELALDGHLDLITISAFLDLVSADWLQRLAIEAAARALPVYAALTYDGKVAFDPADPHDKRVIDAFNRHQLIDKGFGPALGPRAARAAIEAFERVGYTVQSGRSDWRFSPQDVDIQLELVAGFAAAAREIGTMALSDLARWIAHRREAIVDGISSLSIGHLDMFARTADTRWGDKSQSNSTSSPIG